MQSPLDSKTTRWVAASAMALDRYSQVLLVLLVICRAAAWLPPSLSYLLSLQEVANFQLPQHCSCGQLFLCLTETARCVIGSQSFSHVGGAAVYKREGWKFSDQ